MKIPFNKPYIVGKELHYIAEAHANGHLSGDGPFTKRCDAWLRERFGALGAALTPSGTAALEMAALLADVKPGDEVIMPSFTFVSTANAFALRGAVPVFVDIRDDTLDLDERLVEAAITKRTRAVVPVHYAGVGCEMDAILEIAARHGILVIEDAAHAVLAGYRGKPLGSFGNLAALSFHETKSIMSGEGGAILVNDPRFAARAEILREKGTNRSAFFRGEVDKYTWVDVGSSYLASEIVAAFLWAQLEAAEEITRRRVAMWNRYHAALEGAERRGLVRRPVVPSHCQHNAHIYYVLLPDLDRRTRFIEGLREAGIHSVFHFVPLHSAPAADRYARASGDLPVTEDAANRLARLPLWIGLEEHQDDVIAEVLRQLDRLGS